MNAADCETCGDGEADDDNPDIVSLESLHSGVNEIYPPWYIHPDSGKDSYNLGHLQVYTQFSVFKSRCGRGKPES